MEEKIDYCKIGVSYQFIPYVEPMQIVIESALKSIAVSLIMYGVRFDIEDLLDHIDFEYHPDVNSLVTATLRVNESHSTYECYRRYNRGIIYRGDDINKEICLLGNARLFYHSLLMPSLKIADIVEKLKEEKEVVGKGMFDVQNAFRLDGRGKDGKLE